MNASLVFSWYSQLVCILQSKCYFAALDVEQYTELASR